MIPRLDRFPSPLPWSGPARGALALGIFALAFGVRLAALSNVEGYAFVEFAPAVLIAAYLCGTSYGILVAILSGFTGVYLFAFPFLAWELTPPALFGLVSFGILSTLILGMVGLLRSHAERARVSSRQLHAEEGLQRARLQTEADAVIEALAEGLLVVGHDGRLRRANRAAERMLGSTEKQMQSLGAVLDRRVLLRPDGSRCDPGEIPAAMVLATGEPVRGVLRGIPDRGDGAGVRWVEANGQPIRDPETGRADAAVVTFQDVTERIEAQRVMQQYAGNLERAVASRTADLAAREGTLRAKNLEIRESLSLNAAMVEHATQGLSVYLADGTCILANQAAADVVGCRQADILAVNFRRNPTWQRYGLVDAANEALASGITQSRELDMRTSAGREASIRFDIVPFKAGDSGRLLVITVDLTKHREMERTLREASRAKGEFLSNMSHEIRTPLNAILGIAQVLEGTSGLGAEQRELVGRLRTAGRSLLGMLNDVLDLSKIEAGRLELEQSPFALADVIEQVAAQMSIGAKGREIEVVVTEPEERVQSLVGDSLRLGQVLTNLVGNALKFTERGCVSLSVRELGESEGKVRLRFSVTDTGIGIPAERQGAIFEDFAQGEGATSRRYGGSGLGLSISRQLVAQMGGELRVRSREGEGSEFWFDLELPLQAGARATAPGEGRRVVIAGDQGVVRASLGTAARRLGWEVETEATGTGLATRLDAAARVGRAVDLVVVDAVLGGEDGVTVGREMRERLGSGAPPIVLLVTEEQRERLRGREDVADVLLTKPVTMAALRGAAQELDRRRGRVVAEVEKRGPLEGVRVLVVDDGPINQEVAQALLSRDGAHVECADDGQAAVEVLRARPGDFDVVLMDLRMPVMDGLEATRAIREELGLRDLPVVACTASSTVEERERAAAAGLDAYTTKPFEAEALVATIAGVLPERGDTAAVTKARTTPAVAEAPADAKPASRQVRTTWPSGSLRARLSMREYGEGERTLLFLHGFGTTQEVWTPQVERFAVRNRVLTYDLAGATWATRPAWSPESHATLRGHARDLVDLCAEMDLRGATFVGHSVSGTIGVLAAVLDPGLFSSLVLLAASPSYTDHREAGYVGGMSRESVDEICAAVSDHFEAWAADFAPMAAGEAARERFGADLLASMLAWPRDVAISTMTSLLRSDFREEYRRCTTPTLVVQPVGDVLVPMQTAEWMAGNLPRGTLVTLPTGTTHLPHVVFHEDVGSAIDAWLTGGGGGEPT